MANKKSSNPTPSRQNVTPEMISKTTGTHNTTHNSHNVGGQTSEHINSGGRSMTGRTSDTDVMVQARKNPKSSK